ncbi:unnamed protein product, partial [Prorocentrum cordatum]
MARVTSEGTHPKDQRAWPAHHCGCSLSHFTMWMEALQRGVQNLIIFESDGFPSCIESFRIGGNVSDFADIVAALPSRAPEGWHLIALDKGDFGAEPGATPVTTLRPASGGGTRSYSMIPWKGRGVAGAAAYMVSRRFLEWFPHDIQTTASTWWMPWIGCRCSDRSAANPSPISCCSIVAEGHRSELACGPWPLPAIVLYLLHSFQFSSTFSPSPWIALSTADGSALGGSSWGAGQTQSVNERCAWSAEQNPREEDVGGRAQQRRRRGAACRQESVHAGGPLAPWEEPPGTSRKVPTRGRRAAQARCVAPRHGRVVKRSGRKPRFPGGGGDRPRLPR